MVAKNKVKKTSFTELYLISKKTLNLLKKKQKENIKNVHQNHTTSNTPAIYQTHHHYISPQSLSRNHLRQYDNENQLSINDSTSLSDENTLSDSETAGDDEYFDDNLQEIFANENLLDENETMSNNIPDNRGGLINISTTPPPENFHSITQEPPQVEDIMNDDIENTQNTPVEIIDYNNLNNRRKNVDFLNQSKRASYLNRKRGNKSDVNVIKSVLQDEIRKMQEKSREKKINTFREKSITNRKPAIVIQPPKINNILRVLPSSSPSSLNDHTLNNIRSHVFRHNPSVPLNITNNNHTQDIQRIHPSTSSQAISTTTTTNGNINVAYTPLQRKRSNPSNTLVKNVINSGVENMDLDSTSITSNSNINNSKTKRKQNNIPPRTKVHKKNKVIIIETPQVENPKNSEFVDKILQSNVNDPYDVFQFSKTARITYAGLKRKFNAFSKKLHPDKEPSPGAHEAFIIMRRAFMQLKKEIQLRDELEKEKTQTKKKQSSTQSQSGFGIKKWMKLCK